MRGCRLWRSFRDPLITRREPLDLPADRFLLLKAMGPLEAHPRHDQVLQAGAVGDHEYPHKEKSERREDEEHCSDVGEIEVHGRLPFWLPDVSG